MAVRLRRLVVVLSVLSLSAVAAAQPTTAPSKSPASRPATSQPAATSRPANDADPNPAARGFNAAESDERAIALADATMAAMGGRAAWDRTRYFSWNFFGARRLVWDKQAGRARVEGSLEDGRKYITLFNVRTQEGRVWIEGEEVADARLRDGLVAMAWRSWINDSYWLVMPYKLKDTGVILTYRGRKWTMEKNQADVVRLVFEEVGVTPENMYDVYIGVESGLVEQWDFYRRAGNLDPSIKSPWLDWKRHGEIMLSAHRGERSLTDVAVHRELPDSVFETPEPTGLFTPN